MNVNTLNNIYRQNPSVSVKTPESSSLYPARESDATVVQPVYDKWTRTDDVSSVW